MKSKMKSKILDKSKLAMWREKMFGRLTCTLRDVVVAMEFFPCEFAHPEIDDAEFAVWFRGPEEEVVGFQIRVCDVVFVEVSHTTHHLQEKKTKRKKKGREKR